MGHHSMTYNSIGIFLNEKLNFLIDEISQSFPKDAIKNEQRRFIKQTLSAMGISENDLTANFEILKDRVRFNFSRYPSPSTHTAVLLIDVRL